MRNADRRLADLGDLRGLPGVVEGADLIGVEGDDVVFIVAVIGGVGSDEGGAAGD